MKSRPKRHQQSCLAAHSLIGKLSTIIGNSDLLIEKTDPGTEQARRLAVIRETAKEVVKELIEHQQQAEAERRRAG
jgi:hypothetical protein